MKEYQSKLAEYHGITVEQMKFIWFAIEQMRKKNWQPITYVEIGVLYGGVFRRAIEHLGDEDAAIGVDLFEEFPVKAGKGNTHKGNVCKLEELSKALQNRGLVNWHLCMGDSAIVVPQLPRQRYVVAVIDGNHTFEATKIDFENVMTMMEKGYIFFHDVDWAGPQKVCREIVEKKYGLVRVKETRGAWLYERS